MEFIVVLIFAACFTCALGNYQYVLAPNVIRLENEETLVVGILGDGKNQSVEIWFEYLNKTISNMTIKVQDAAHPVKVTVKITADDLFKNIDVSPKFRDRPTSIKLVCKGPNGNQSQNISLGYTPGYLIVQTDKPLYNPSQIVHFRVLAMDEAMKPIKDKQIEIYLISPSDMTVGRHICVPGPSNNGFCRDDFELPPFPDFGTWTIKAQFGGKLETYAIAPIEVREFVIPTFGVEVKPVERSILPNDTTLTVEVSAMYVYGKPVEGNSGLNVNIRKKGDILDPATVVTMGRLQLQNGKAIFRVNVTKLIKKEFPTDAKLELIATVFESATEKEESGSDDSVTFVNAPYKFDLSRCKKSYRTGKPYYMPIYMLYMDGTPAGETHLVVGIYDDGKWQADIKNKTNKDGRFMAVIHAINTAVIRTLKVYAPGYGDYSAELILKPYAGSNHIVVEKVKKDDASFITASTDIETNRLNQYTGIVFLVISRGKIVQTEYIENHKNLEFQLTDDVVKKASPVGRVFAFYVNKNNNKLEADSSVFYETPMCREKLVLRPSETNIKPGFTYKLNVTGPSGMTVGFNIIDTALLLLNNENILKEDRIFNEMEEHDLGCGAGGGVTSEEVFKNAGLTILINADVQAQSMYREKTECIENRRKRRAAPDANGCYYGADPKCCEEAVEYAFNVIHEYEIEKQHFDSDVSQPIPHTVCYAKARQLSIQYPDKLPTKCPLAFYEACFMTLSAELSVSHDARGRSIFSNTHDQYEQDLDAFGRDNMKNLKVRKNFETSFFFHERELGTYGLETIITYKDSITTWSIQAIGITENMGACIATPVEVTAFKECFVQVHLPYKVTRKEHFNVEVTVFNYAKDTQRAKVYLNGVDDLCYGSSPGVPSPPQVVSLGPNNASTLMFPMIPLKAGSFPITVTAFLTSTSGTTSLDVVQKKLLVVSEGIQEKKNFTICLDPNKQMENCAHSFRVEEERIGSERPLLRMAIELPLTASALPGTVKANAYFKSNMMGTPVACVLEGVDKRFKEPSGCGEQNMIKLAPIVYGLYFLKETGKITQQHEESAYQKMRRGILIQRSEHQKPDGSFSIYKDYPPSLWLTAFVAKVFCQADQVVKGVVIMEDLKKTLMFIAKNNNVTNGEGYFFDEHPVYAKYMQGILGKGDGKKDPALTAFVLTALQECSERTTEVEHSIQRAMSALEKTPLLSGKVDSYLLAISTYALAMSNSNKKAAFKAQLFESRMENEGRIYWTTRQGDPDVETTAYALLAFLKFDDFKTCHKIVAWLTEQCTGIGMWYTTQDTVVAMQALAKYSARTHNPEVNLDIIIRKNNWKQLTNLNNENSLFEILISNLPVDHGDRKFEVEVTGTGSGILKIDMFYNRKAFENESCPFNISHIDIKDVNSNITNNQHLDIVVDRQCDVCGFCEDPEEVQIDHNVHFKRRRRRANSERQAVQKCVQFSVKSKTSADTTSMSIVKIDLETGVRVVESDFQNMQDDGLFPRFEMPRDHTGSDVPGGFIIVYINNITTEAINFKFRLEDSFLGNSSTRRPASIHVYDYYKPERSCIKPYGIGSSQGKIIQPDCRNDTTDQCECMQSQCVKTVEEELVVMALIYSKEKDATKKRELKKPADALLGYACDFTKANNVVKVNVKNIGLDSQRDMRVANATIEDVLLQGGNVMVIGERIDLEWFVECKTPALLSNHTYYIIGKDGTTYSDKKTVKKYALSGTALVIDPEYKPLLGSIMKNFAKMLKENNGCVG